MTLDQRPLGVLSGSAAAALLPNVRVRPADGAPFANASVPVAAWFDTLTTERAAGWALHKAAGNSGLKIAFYLGGTLIGSGEPTLTRHDVAQVVGPAGAKSGYAVRLPLPGIAAALASALASVGGDTSQQIALTAVVTVGDDEYSVQCNSQVRHVRKIGEWLAFYGITLVPEMLASRRERYARLARIVTPDSPDSFENLDEWYLTSFVATAALEAKKSAIVSAISSSQLFDKHYIRKQFTGRQLDLGAVSDISDTRRRSFDPAYEQISNSFPRVSRFRLKDDSRHLALRYLALSRRVDLRPHPLFHSIWYRLTFDIPAAVDPLFDYLSGGWMFGREPNFLFCAPYLSASGLPEDRQGAQRLSPLERLLIHARRVASEGAGQRSTEFAAHPFLFPTADPVNQSVREHLFAPEFYRRQLAPRERAVADVVTHYSDVGELAGIWPNAMFDPHEYRRRYRYMSAVVGPYADYFIKSRTHLRNPGKYFSTRYYLSRYRDVAIAGRDPFEHFLERNAVEPGRRPCEQIDTRWYAQESGEPFRAFLEGINVTTCSPHPALIVSPRASREAVMNALFEPSWGNRRLPFGIEAALMCATQNGPRKVTTCGELREAVSGFEDSLDRIDATDVRKLQIDEPIVRMSEIIDYRRTDRKLAQLVQRLLPEPAPLVSVIMPARNRASVIGAAINSVLAQKFENFELLVVDDGSVDNTTLVVEGVKDARVQLLRRPPRGVSAARNAGVEVAKGTFIAYLDSDNTWEPLYLQAMVSALLETGGTSAHAILRVVNPVREAVRYRGDVYDQASLDRENYIDMNVFVHHRRAIDSGIRFDETLRRCVDWDFIRRLCLDTGPSQFVEIVGCNYLDDEGPLGRISTSELTGDFYKLALRQADFSPHVRGAGRPYTPLFSIVWPLFRDDEATMKRQIWHAVHHLRFSRHELILINNGLTYSMCAFLAALSGRVEGLRVIHLWRSFMAFPAANLGATFAEGERLLFWSVRAGYDAERIDAFMGDMAASGDALSFPVPVDGDGRVVRGPFIFAKDGSGVLPAMEGQWAEKTIGSIEGVGVDVFPAAIKRELHLDLGGFDTDYALRSGLIAQTARILREQRGAVTLRFDHPIKIEAAVAPIGDDKAAAREVSFLRSALKLPQNVVPKPRDPEVHVPELRVRAQVEAAGLELSVPSIPFVRRRAPGGELSCRIMCPAPLGAKGLNWGDLHFANSLADALERLGHSCRVVRGPAWHMPAGSADVVIHLRGITGLNPVPGAVNLLWNISHPDRLSAPELEMADAVLVASDGAVEFLWRRFGIRGMVLPQATDAQRFAFRRDSALPTLADRFLFVGNSRRRPRAIVMDAVGLSLPLDIYGEDWEFFIGPNIVRRQYLPNADLPDHYRSAAAVLNDHWPAMAKTGIISNRLFDVTAVGGLAISDEIAGVDELFRGHVRTYRTRAELADLTLNIADWAPSLDARRDLSHDVLRDHSFDARAREIVRIAENL